MTTAFLADFSNWLPGMTLAMIIYHLSAYLFTKDKSFLIYSVYLILSIFYIKEITHARSELPLNQIHEIYNQPHIWLLLIYLWMLFGWFFLTFLNLKRYDEELTENIIKYLIANTIFFTILFLIDSYFLKSTYFFKFISVSFIPISLFFVAFIVIRLLGIRNRLTYFFIVGFVTLAIGTLEFFIAMWFPNINFGVNKAHPEYNLMLGMFIETLVMSIGLAYQYQYYRKQRVKMNNSLISELQRNERLTTNYNLELSHKIDEIKLELETASRQAEDYKMAQLNAKFQSEIKQLKLSSLLSHMNSHFIFNSLNSIKLFIIEGDQKKAAYYLNKFSKLIREILDASIVKEKSLLEELKTMQLYTSIENIRFNDKINFIFNSDKNLNLDKVMVPPLILHPFIENAIWHGLSPKEGEKNITITTKKEEGWIIVCITDNGIGRKKANEIEAKRNIKRTRFGIEATRERLRNFYKNENEFTLKINDLFNNNKPTGTQVLLQILADK